MAVAVARERTDGRTDARKGSQHRKNMMTDGETGQLVYVSIECDAVESG